MATYLGVSEADRGQFASWTESIVQAGSGGHADGALDALAGLYGFFTELVERRRVEPGDDMISTLVAAHDGGFADRRGRSPSSRGRPDGIDDGSLPLEEILGYAFVMVAGGNDTAIGLLGGSAELLTDHPDQRARLLDDPTLVPNAVEECLRLVSPVQGLCRVVTQPVEVHGETLAPGTACCSATAPPTATRGSSATTPRRSTSAGTSPGS